MTNIRNFVVKQDDDTLYFSFEADRGFFIQNEPANESDKMRIDTLKDSLERELKNQIVADLIDKLNAINTRIQFDDGLKRWFKEEPNKIQAEQEQIEQEELFTIESDDLYEK